MTLALRLAALAGLSLTAAGPAPAQPIGATPNQRLAAPGIEFLENGIYLAGRLNFPRDVACFYLPTTAGQKIQAGADGIGELNPVVTVGAGSTCDKTIQVFGRDKGAAFGTEPAVVPFVAGGGTYIVQVSGAGNTVGSFRVRYRENPDASRRFPAGLPIVPVFDPRFAPGVSASTAPPSGKPVPEKGTVFKDCLECPQMVVIPAGSFMMGSNASEPGHKADEGPRHMVMFARPFALGKTEVTFEEWDACVLANGCSFVPGDEGWGRGRRPVIAMTYHDAMQYVRWLRRKTGEAYYLPSESEWEYAARAGTQTPWNTGKAIITDDANILNALGRTVPVGAYPVNAFGLEGMHGNVAELVADCYDVGYFGAPLNGGAVETKGCATRIARGGSFGDDPATARSANRWQPQPDFRYRGLGFRVARAL